MSLKEKISQIFTDGIKFDSEGEAYPDRGEIESNLEKLFKEAFSTELENLLNEINTFQEHAEEPNPTLQRVNKAIFKRIEKARKELGNG